MTTKFPVYCTPADVAETLDLPDPNDNQGTLMFTASSHPSQSRVVKMICSNEDQIDKLLKRSQRTNFVEDEVTSIHNHWHDGNGARIDYRNDGGDYIQLRKDVLDFDPTPIQDSDGNMIYHGDRIEMRTRGNQWFNITPSISETPTEVAESTHSTTADMDVLANTQVSFWIDYKLGRLYLRHSAWQPQNDAVRISYRYGAEMPTTTDESGHRVFDPYSDDDNEKYGVPSAINRMCCLMTAINVLNMQMFNIKVGSNGDLGEVRNSVIRQWQDEINMIFASFRRTGSVHSLLR